MLNIVWIDKTKSFVSGFLEKYGKPNNITVQYFGDFDSAWEYILNHKNEVSAVISNYSTLSWPKLYLNRDYVDLFPSGFEFFDEMCTKQLNIPFVMFSGMCQFDERFEKYKSNANYHFVAKDFCYKLKCSENPLYEKLGGILELNFFDDIASQGLQSSNKITRFNF
ncbi:hypothetical protein MEO40_07025 [Dolichospermum sp. ST_sed1]|nr:hypothetical protein [Dolichospermum sp. ST_sed1]